ncbi:MAG: response regulator transcription factor [Planctomycetes bacterium]|jgi:DNA-binding NarL/FixJ family response regulator|nr:response regulator transcription factor [Planctomycetota bacterium]
MAPPQNPRRHREVAVATRNHSDDPRRPEKRIRVVVADDHEPLRRCVCRLLSEQPHLEVVGQAANGHEAVSLARQLLPDIILMDVNMPRMNGVEATQQITQDFPTVRVLAMSADWNQIQTSLLLRAGAAGCVSKIGDFDTLLRTLETLIT